MTHRILVIDDEDDIREVAALSLETVAGWQVYMANSGTQGLARAIDLQPDAILLDVMMPGMDGFEVARSLKTNPLTQSIPIVVASSLDDNASRKRMMAIKIDAFLVKPIDRWELSRQVAEILDARRNLQPSGSDA